MLRQICVTAHCYTRQCTEYRGCGGVGEGTGRCVYVCACVCAGLIQSTRCLFIPQIKSDIVEADDRTGSASPEGTCGGSEAQTAAP